MLDKLYKKQGNTLIGVLVVIVIIIFAYFGSLFFLDKDGESNIEKANNIVENAKNDIDNINDIVEDENKIIEGGTENVDANEEEESRDVDENIDLDASDWGEVIIDSYGFKIKYHRDWYYTVNRREALQDGYNMIVGFEEDENIWEKLPPFIVELIVLEKDMEFEGGDKGYLKTVEEKDDLKYILYTDKEEYKSLVDEMSETFKFLDKKVEESNEEVLKTYQNEEYGFEFQYPKNYNRNVINNSGNKVLFDTEGPGTGLSVEVKEDNINNIINNLYDYWKKGEDKLIDSKKIRTYYNITTPEEAESRGPGAISGEWYKALVENDGYIVEITLNRSNSDLFSKILETFKFTN